MQASDMTDIDGSAISHHGMMLLGYQRTKQISRKARLSWEAGNPAVLDAEIQARRDAVFSGATAEIRAEYEPLRDFLRDRAIAPRRVVDIGCGQAINDVFLFRDFGCAVTLVDIEDTPQKYHLWNDSGSGYAALADAVALLVANGMAEHDVTAINPRKTPDRLAGLAGDLVCSLFSCGFHYPVGEYIDLMCDTVANGGSVVLDLRLRYLNAPDADLGRLLAAGQRHVLLDMAKSQRILVRA